MFKRNTVKKVTLTVIMGRSFSGKTTYLNKKIAEGKFRQVKTHTTRPVRPSELGNEYVFRDNVGYNRDAKDGLVLSPRAYKTIEGVWYYWLNTQDLLYGREQILKSHKGNKDTISLALILDPVGAMDLVRGLNQTRLIKYFDLRWEYLNTSWGDILKRTRESSRATENPKEILRRLAEDEEQFRAVSTYVEVHYQGRKDPVLDVTGMITRIMPKETPDYYKAKSTLL